MNFGHALTPFSPPQRDFNPLTREDALNPDLKFPEGEPVHTPFVNYIASKVLAERAAWNVASSPTCHYKFTVINPTYIFGPSVLPLTNGSDSLSFSNQLIWKTATAAGKPHLPLDWPFMVDVRDVARSHVVALQKDEAAGRRFILSATNFTYTEVILMANLRIKAWVTHFVLHRLRKSLRSISRICKRPTAKISVR